MNNVKKKKKRRRTKDGDLQKAIPPPNKIPITNPANPIVKKKNELKKRK